MQYDLDFARTVIEDEAKAVGSLARIIDGSFEKAVDLMCNCTGSVIVSGMGKAGIIGNKISATLASTGTPSHFLHPAEGIHGDLGRVQANDVVLALSHSGESEEIVRIIEPLKQREIKLISITGNPKSSLAKHSDVVLAMGKQVEACPLGIAPSVSTTCMLALGDALAFTIMKAREFSTEDYARFHPGGAIGANLITVGQSMMFKPGEKLPLAQTSDTIDDMFKRLEGVKRRGAVMVVNDKGQLAGIITDADLRRAMAKFDGELFAKGCTEIMTPDCKRVTAETLAAEAMAIFHKYRIDELPVVDENDRPIGLIDVQDIVAIKIAR
ncbi:KpsF/GutQ family sugar-phosphate isomerase [Anaerohalosphaera lusitana]|uniref:KpsF/GutQ family sugar-phosphate isomerase n=1 Tax=Anaerohalosphaera lusitana TaxID=1936003 RepID=UPI00197BA56B|nr:KpsF/GutQ family sugar-phosphate isomerase [Anaerohalosphaera lusitana]